MAAKFAKPWYRADRSAWFVTVDGKQTNLGPDKDEAFRRYHAMMLQPRPKPVVSGSVAAIVDAFLDWCEKHRSA